MDNNTAVVLMVLIVAVGIVIRSWIRRNKNWYD